MNEIPLPSPRRRRFGGALLWWSIAAIVTPVAMALFLFGFLIDPDRAGIERDLQRAVAHGKLYTFGEINPSEPWWKLAVQATGYADYPAMPPFFEQSVGVEAVEVKLISGPIRRIDLFDEPGDAEGFQSALLRARRLRVFHMMYDEGPLTEKSRTLIATLGAMPELEEALWCFTEPHLSDETWFRDLMALPHLRRLDIVIRLPREFHAYRRLTIPGKQLLAVQAVHQMRAKMAEPSAALAPTVYVLGLRKSPGGHLTPFPNPPLVAAN